MYLTTLYSMLYSMQYVQHIVYFADLQIQIVYTLVLIVLHIKDLFNTSPLSRIFVVPQSDYVA